MRLITALAWLVAGATVLPACSRDLQAMDAQQIESTYGVSGAFADTIATPDGPLQGMRVPITLANGSPTISSRSTFRTSRACIPCSSART